MKKSSFVVAALFANLISILPALAQTSTVVNKETRRIEVTGFSEMEVMPDELYFTVSLREYYKDEKNQKDKVQINVLEKQLVQAVTEAGLPKEALSVSGVGGYQRYWEKDKKPSTFLESKQYQLKVERADKLDGILSKVDSRGIQSAHMSRADHSRKEEFKNQVKVEALKNAKEKAAFLLNAIGEKAGPVLEIRELEEGASYPQPMYRSSLHVASVEADGVPDSDLDYQKIKLSYRMQAVFEIK
ncbi:SIMPL domain-containing protein [Persicitalea jodogahamensis]|uniref:DUF541 domain-containing protein n=1 Tax=Persicitalea jodogahamensis TaxID=402147 RepID=A0A8J3DEC5_9BACT|nr:SIMPL domain-containing protein [Persicitalea jodogahamensis]GHB88592.1 hypothetical protein GCM10007390_50930 [Persicitalea jodogahamensis]